MDKICVQHTNESKKQLKTGGLKITSTRLQLLDIFKHAKKPLSIKELAKSIGAKADEVTLYRNIESFENLGLLKQIRFQDRQAYYELSGDHHHHIVCQRCGKIADVKNCRVNLPKASVAAAGFKKLKGHSLEFFGLCNSCAK
jgi:Fur family ferric uptake transcriptional regulator